LDLGEVLGTASPVLDPLGYLADAAFDVVSDIEVEVAISTGSKHFPKVMATRVAGMAPFKGTIDLLMRPTPAGVIRGETLRQIAPPGSSYEGWGSFDKQLASQEDVLKKRTTFVKGLDRAVINSDDSVRMMIRSWTPETNLRKTFTAEASEIAGKAIQKTKAVGKATGAAAAKALGRGAARKLPRSAKVAKTISTAGKKVKQGASSLGRRLHKTVKTSEPRFVGVKVADDLPSTRAKVVKFPVVGAWMDELAYAAYASEPTTPNLKGAGLKGRVTSAVLDARIDKALTSAADQGLTSKAAYDYVVKQIPEAKDSIVPAENTRGGDVVNVKEKDLPKKKPPTPLGKRFLGAIPLVGVGIDLNEARIDFSEGEYLKGAAHLGDALLGATIIGDVFNIAANVAGYDGAFTAVVESDILEDIASVDFLTEEEIDEINEDPTSFADEGSFKGGGVGGSTLL
jgi:hypothetical protein